MDIYENRKTEGEEMNFEGREASSMNNLLLNYQLILDGKRLRIDIAQWQERKKKKKRLGPGLYQTSRT